MDDYISRQTGLRCIKESREDIDWGQSEDGDAFLHYSAALYRTVASKECVPAADVVQVVHGRWVNGRCDKCGEHAPYWSMASTYYESDFCPNCGAKMRGEQE